ncbi:alpha-1,2-fucosyltransferase [Sphingomonas sp. R86520]|uniref:alpha-1,2-fucosyltransferase n=1 Tax=Sphingomonas sp. R86520 TaxID=3093859 RepID=UPI0036D3B3F2
MRLTDGLGNQLFQYAAAATLQARTGAEIGFLVDAFDSVHARPDRPLLLPELVDCRDQLIRTRSARGLAAVAIHRLLRPRGTAVRHVPGICHIAADAGCHPGFARIRDPMLVAGFFQAWACVEPGVDAVQAAVRKRFGPRMTAARKALETRLAGTGRIVALHLRLGDYLTIGDGQEAVVPVARVRAVLAGLEPEARVIAFTDTPDALDAIDFGRPVPRFPGATALDDFAAMAACDDFVIANSTFSWWASSLGDTAGKRVWVPRDWKRPARPGSDSDNPIYRPDHRRY